MRNSNVHICFFLRKLWTQIFSGQKFIFFIFRLRVKKFFPLGFSFLSSVGTFQRERGSFWIILGHFGSFWVILIIWGDFGVILGHFGHFWLFWWFLVILGHFGSFWSFLTWIGPKRVFGHISCPPAPISKIQVLQPWLKNRWYVMLTTLSSVF